MQEGKQAYRYRVTDTWGVGEERMGGSPFIIEDDDMGEEYTWIITHVQSFAPIGTITGVFVDTGVIVSGQFVSDEEINLMEAISEECA